MLLLTQPRPRGRGRGASKRVAAARGGGLPPSGPRSRVAKKAPLSTPAAGGLSADSVVGTSSSATSLNFAALRLEALRRYRRAFRITDAAMGAGTGTDLKTSKWDEHAPQGTQIGMARTLKN